MFWKNNSSIPTVKVSSKDAFPSVLTKDMNIMGNIVSEGIIDFNGTIEGNIRCRTITIREEGNVKGEVAAENAFVYGKVNGLIRARNVHLFSSCHIEGIVMHESLTIEDGAFIDGKCKRMDKNSDAEGSSSSAPVPVAVISDASEPASSVPMLEAKPSKKSQEKGKILKYSIISG